MKIIAAIQARMGSTRFPGKVMADLCGKPVLQWVIEKAQGMNVNEVVVLTSHKEENKEIKELTRKNNIRPIYWTFNDLQCFYWYYSIGDKRKIDYIIRICGDSPFIDIDLANLLIDRVTDEYDYYSYRIDGTPAILTRYGIFVEIFSVQKIKAIMEHVTVPFYTDFNQSYIDWCMPVKYKLSIDYPSDLEIAKKVIEYHQKQIDFERVVKKDYSGDNEFLPNYKQINKIMKDYPELQWHGEEGRQYDWNK